LNLFLIFRIAMKAVGRNKLRSGLTMLGIMIGVGAVISMIAIGSGAKARIQEQMAAMGSNLLIVRSGSATSGGVRMGAGSVPTLTAEDAEAIAEEIPAVKYAAPRLNGVAQLVFENQNWSTTVRATTPEALWIRDWPVVRGRLMNQADLDRAAKVCLLGQTVKEYLFGQMNPVGQIVRINKFPFTVIGVLAMKGQTSWGRDRDDTVYIPLTTGQRLLFGAQFPGMVHSIMVQARTYAELKPAEAAITRLLRQRHRIRPKQEDDFSIRNLTEFMTTAEASAGVMSLLLGAMASISLLVGGIGIMNIMLVSVTERTREIGIRLAVGARSRDILFQFLMESLVLSLIGGAVGVLLGILASQLLTHFFKWPTLISHFALLLAFSFSAGVGIFFGFYPARKAARLDPIEALRYE
jgi:putative ABC transport system permease protein